MATDQCITIKPKIKATNRYRYYLQITSLFLQTPITPLEVDILDELYSCFDSEVTTDARKQIQSKFNKSPDLVNNYIRKMRLKKLLIGDAINPKLIIPIPNESMFPINIEMHIVG